MDDNNRFFSLETKIIMSTIIPVIVSFTLVFSAISITLFNSFEETAKAEFLQISQKYSVSFEGKIVNAMNYLSIVASMLELQVETGSADREMLQKTVLNIFDSYKLIDGSSIYFEPNMYDGRDNEYINSEYGTSLSGRICYYFYMVDGKTAYLPEAMEDEVEFELPHYTEAQEANKAIYTKPVVYEIDGKDIPMFTLTYPVRGKDGKFIGAVTVDLFLEDIYEQLQNEEIYDTGYIVITNDKDLVIYSPIFEDIGVTREKAGVDYSLPSKDESSADANTASVINGKNCFVTTSSIYIPKLDSYFYISVAAPTEEINARATKLMAVLIAFIMLVVITIALLLYYLIGRISAPIKAITESANKIANGDMNEAEAFVSGDRDIKTRDEVYILFIAMKKMLAQLTEIQNLRLEALELKLEKEKAESAAQAKNDFLAKMSHEIRTPMNAVMGMIELILRKDLPQDVYENALVIKSAGTNLLSIINDILDFSKIESGMLEIIETDYMLPSLINDVLNSIRIRLADKPIQFVADIDPSVPAQLIGDEIRIRQIVTNLLSNSVKYTKEGYISFAVTGTISGDTVALVMEISDSGIGIKEEDIGKLFGDFVQIDTVKNKGIEGTGLGLSISRSLCQMMGGDITARSEYGNGSTFTITLSQRFQTYTPFASLDDPQGKSVLIYETRQHYGDSVVRAFEKMGVNYKVAENIASLFANLEQYTYVFISSFMYSSINPALSKLKNPPKLVLLTDITEMMAPRDARTLTMPAHSLSIANILDDVNENYGGTPVTGASFIAPDAKVLIVDDITANLRVGEGLLAPYEVQVTLCKSGREALELVADEQFDLVFMDHMMPEMDGLETTSHIRALGGDYFQSLPIVALTANAVSGVREMFIQNGMNDFLSKPIETAKLDAILEKWLPEEKRKKIKLTESSPETSDFVDMLRSVSELSVDKALAVVGGSVNAYEKMIKLCIRLLPENTARLDELIDTDLPSYAIEVHGIKGVLNNIGAYKLGIAAYELVELSRQGDLEFCKMLHPGFIDRLTEFSDLMTTLINDADAPTKTDGDISVLKDAIPKLKDALDYYDSVLALDILSFTSAHTFGPAVDKMIDELTRAFESFDFDRAAGLVDELKRAVE